MRRPALALLGFMGAGKSTHPTRSAILRGPPDRPALALLGFMGAGKSTIGRLVAEAERAPFRDLDEVIAMSVGMTIAGFFERRGVAAFREVEARLLRDLVDPGVVLALGGGAVIDDGSWQLVRERALTVWLDAPLDVLLERSGGITRPLLRGRSRQEIEELLDSRRRRYGEAAHRVDAGRPLTEVVAEVRRLWAV